MSLECHGAERLVQRIAPGPDALRLAQLAGGAHRSGLPAGCAGAGRRRP